ncbi:MAG: hypothetical protein JKY53_14950 [Flavobacteriales bacterium]|nr:hypothetical protein [Flavobacteriales bacterium]
MNNLTYRLKSAFIIVMIVSVFFPLMIVLDVDEPHWQAGSIGTLLISFIAAFRLGYIALKGEVVPLLMTFWIFVAFWMGLAGFAQTLKNDFFWWGQYSSVDQFMAVLVVFLALLAYEFGRWFLVKQTLIFLLFKC